MNKDLEEELEAQEDKVAEYDTMKNNMEKLKISTGGDAERVVSLEADLEKMTAELTELKGTGQNHLNREKQQLQERLQVASEKVTDLEGRLAAQQEHYDEHETALAEAKKLEEEMKAKLEEKDVEFQKERTSLEASFKEKEEQALAELNEIQINHDKALSTKEIEWKHWARNEIDTHESAAQQANDNHQNAESKIVELNLQLEEVRGQYGRLKDNSSSSSEVDKANLHESKRQVATLETEVEGLQKTIQDHGFEIERLKTSQSQELERLDKSLQAEVEKRNATEKIHQSKIEEKDMELGSAAFKAEELEKDLEKEKAKVTEKEEKLTSLQEQHEQAIINLNLTHAEVEKKLRSTSAELLEVKGMMEVSRQHQEELNAIRSKDIESSGEAAVQLRDVTNQLSLMTSQKEGKEQELKDHQEDSERDMKELQEVLDKERADSKESLKKATEGIAKDLETTRSQLSATEADLLTTKQRVENLTKDKATLQEDQATAQTKMQAAEELAAKAKEDKENLSLELDQVKQQKDGLETNLATVREEKRTAGEKIEQLQEEVTSKASVIAEHADNIQAKVKYYDGLLTEEKARREALGKSLQDARSDGDGKSKEANLLQLQLEQDLLDAKATAETHKTKVEETERQVSLLKEQLEASKRATELADNQRRDNESTLRCEVATLEAKLTQASQEAQRSSTSVEEQKAKLASSQNELAAKITTLERQVGDVTRERDDHQKKVQEAENNLATHGDSKKELQETLNMAAEELFQRQVEANRNMGDLKGRLEESRRTIRTSMLPAGAMLSGGDSGRAAELQKQLSEEQTKGIQQAVSIKRTERQLKRLEDKQTASEEQRKQAVDELRRLQEEYNKMKEDTRKHSQQLLKVNEVRERAHMTQEDLVMFKENSRIQLALLRGHLSEARRLNARPGGKDALTKTIA